MSKDSYRLLDGDVRIFIEQEEIHMLAFDTKSNVPVELTTDIARDIARILIELADYLDKY